MIRLFSILFDFKKILEILGKSLEKASENFYGYIWSFERHYFSKKQEIMRILEPMVEFCANRDRYSDICRASCHSCT